MIKILCFLEVSSNNQSPTLQLTSLQFTTITDSLAIETSHMKPDKLLLKVSWCPHSIPDTYDLRYSLDSKRSFKKSSTSSRRTIFQIPTNRLKKQVHLLSQALAVTFRIPTVPCKPFSASSTALTSDIRFQ